MIVSQDNQLTYRIKKYRLCFFPYFSCSTSVKLPHFNKIGIRDISIFTGPCQAAAELDSSIASFSWSFEIIWIPFAILAISAAQFHPFLR